MRVAILSESAADEAGLRVIVDALLGFKSIPVENQFAQLGLECGAEPPPGHRQKAPLPIGFSMYLRCFTRFRLVAFRRGLGQAVGMLVIGDGTAGIWWVF